MRETLQPIQLNRSEFSYVIHPDHHLTNGQQAIMRFQLQAPASNINILWHRSGWVMVQVLIDPVCLMTCYPDLLQNFIYCQPSWSSVFSEVGFMDALRFVCSRDLLIAEVGHYTSLCGKHAFLSTLESLHC